MLERTVVSSSLPDRPVSSHAVGQAQDHVVGAGVAVHGDTVEGLIDRRRQSPLERRRFDGRIGGEKGQHGGHVGMDHAGAFGDPADCDDRSVHPATENDGLRSQIGCQNCTGCLLSSAGTESSDQSRDVADDPVDGQGTADHAGRTDKHLVSRDGKGLCDRRGHGFCRDESIRPRAGVGVSAVHDDRATLAATEVQTVESYGRGLNAILGEDAGDRAGDF
ncbi:protein of unknown function [Candidatus Nitrospira inopinata]|uniref:Uncharacterized protein n=1 Tax=Candidatus Nitrospira inopinata TaxID=1715989 RepID=A0A0S4KW82_9BACT|nr:protein of unknown function [Candidatus Nitrospira inopinata]